MMSQYNSRGRIKKKLGVVSSLAAREAMSIAAAGGIMLMSSVTTSARVPLKEIKLPSPLKKGKLSLEETIERRRSVRKFLDEPVSLGEAAQLLWAAQGHSGNKGFRAAPSAGAIYPFEIYLVAEKVSGLERGVYLYSTQKHALALLSKVSDEKPQPQLLGVSGQDFVYNCACAIVLVVNYERIKGGYSDLGVRFADMEAGHIGQNIYLQAESLGLGTTAVGAFDSEMTAEYLGLADNLEPVYIFPIGRR